MNLAAQPPTQGNRVVIVRSPVSATQPRTELLRPPDEKAAQQLREHYGSTAAFIAGGTQLQPGSGEKAEARWLIDVSRLPALRGISSNPEGSLRIGAAAALEQIHHHEWIAAQAPLLRDACSTLAAMPIRTLGTLGGNIGWRRGDTLAALLALDARLECVASDASDPSATETVALGDVLERATLPLIVAIHLPLREFVAGRPAIEFFEKVGLRAAFTPTRLALACSITVNASHARGGKVRVAATGAQLPGRRLPATEAVIEACLDSERLGPVDRDRLHDACTADIAEDSSLARLAGRLLFGHISMAIASGALR